MVTAADFPAEKLRKYFNTKYRGTVFIEVKRLVAMDLRSKGLKLQYISEILYGDINSHDSVLNLLKEYKLCNYPEAKQNYLEWIEKDLIPKTWIRIIKPRTKEERAMAYDNGKVKVVTFKLVSA